MTGGRRWTVYDRYGNAIYLTYERWEHITAPTNHPEMNDETFVLDYDELSDTLYISFYTPTLAEMVPIALLRPMDRMTVGDRTYS